MHRTLLRLHHTFMRWRGVALVRAFYWRHVRAYDCEICHECGRPVRVVWTADSGQWLEVMGHFGGVLCIPCFDEKSSGSLRWVPRPL